MHAPVEIAVAYGDGVGPEIMTATLSCLNAVGAPLSVREVEVGEKAYLNGHLSGIAQESWDILLETRAFLKAPITTPQGKGFRSLNVAIRSALGLYANIRPCRTYAPFVRTLHPNMDVVIIRENEEDLYMGIEYHLSEDTKAAIKIITRQGSERVIRYAFEYAVAHNRKKVSCFTKDNIMKLTDGFFHHAFDAVRQQYPDIQAEHLIVDIGAAKLADTPHNFDVVVLPNLYGDILSDVAAQIAGSIGLAGSANIGSQHAMFEAIHGSAPRRAGQNIANPSGLLLSAVMMLNHVGMEREAGLLHNAWLVTLEDGINTYDLYQEEKGRVKVGTDAFARAVIERLGRSPKYLTPAVYKPVPSQKNGEVVVEQGDRKHPCGAEFYIEITSDRSEEVVLFIQRCKKIVEACGLMIEQVFSRGTSIWAGTSLHRPICGHIVRMEIRRAQGRTSSEEFTLLIAKLHLKMLEAGVIVRALFYL